MSGTSHIAVEVLRMASAGVAPAVIAVETGLRPSTVYSQISWARRNGHPIPDLRHGRRAVERRYVTFAPAEFAPLQLEADRRGLSLQALCERIIRIVADEPALVTAILDDAEDLPEVRHV